MRNKNKEGDVRVPAGQTKPPYMKEREKYDDLF